jgi:hypothetical protein
MNPGGRFAAIKARSLLAVVGSIRAQRDSRYGRLVVPDLPAFFGPKHLWSRSTSRASGRTQVLNLPVQPRQELRVRGNARDSPSAASARYTDTLGLKALRRGENRMPTIFTAVMAHAAQP